MIRWDRVVSRRNEDDFAVLSRAVTRVRVFHFEDLIQKAAVTVGNSPSSTVFGKKIIVWPPFFTPLVSFLPGTPELVFVRVSFLRGSYAAIFVMDIEDTRFYIPNESLHLVGLKTVQLLVGPARSKIWAGNILMSKARVSTAVRVRILIPPNGAYVTLRSNGGGLSVRTVAGKQQLDSSLTSILIQFSHHGAVARKLFVMPSEPIEENHVYFVSEAEVQLSLDPLDECSPTIAPVVCPAINLSKKEPISCRAIPEVRIIFDIN
jgi:hypothetical protein